MNRLHQLNKKSPFKLIWVWKVNIQIQLFLTRKLVCIVLYQISLGSMQQCIWKWIINAFDLAITINWPFSNHHLRGISEHPDLSFCVKYEFFRNFPVPLLGPRIKICDLHLPFPLEFNPIISLKKDCKFKLQLFHVVWLCKIK